MKDKLFELFETNGELHLETVALNISMAAVLGFLILFLITLLTRAQFTARNSMHPW